MDNNFSKSFFYEKRGLLRIIFFLVFDVALIALSVVLAFLLRFELGIPEQYFVNILAIIGLAVPITILIFYFSKLYYFSWTYVSTSELISLARATIFSFLVLVALFLLLRDQRFFSGFPRSTLFITYFFIFLLCGALRFSKRVYLQITLAAQKKEKEKTLIVGAGDAGEQILRSIQTSPHSPYLPLGFVDDHPVKQGILIHGLKVLGKIENIPELIKEYKIENLIIALPSAGAKVIKEAVELGRKAGLQKIKTIPSLSEIIDGEVSLSSLRQVQVEDLLGRAPVSLNQGAIEKFIKDKTVLITGAAGSIGSELSRQVAKFKPVKLLLLDQDETGIFNISEELLKRFPKLEIIPLVADIIDEEKIEKIFGEHLPNLVFHAAAYKHVPLMEEQPDTAVKNNVFGTETLAKAALKYNIEKFIFISTDKAVNPSSIMGSTKRVGEMICQAFSQKNHTKFVSVRFGNVLDSRGSVIPIFREQIKKRGPIEITHPDMKRYFMTTPEACLLVLQAGELGQGGEVFVLDMGEPVKILDLAKAMIKLSGFEPDKDIPIVISGMRPGEKLFEEILTAEEGILATNNQKIFIAKLSQTNVQKLQSGLEKLKIFAKNQEREQIAKKLKEIISNK